METLCLNAPFFDITDYRNAVTLQTGLRVRQGHWKNQPTIEGIGHPIYVP